MKILKINDYQYNIKNNLTLIQACLINKVDVPRFCFHEKLSIAGNCRMCLVEEAKQVKPLASCAIDADNLFDIHTNTLKVKKARESVLEFLLANHPLDCPICDQGGECDLQDQSLIFGSDRGRFYEFKRAVEDKDCGPLIKTIMNRCIHCTRCVRFSNEIAGNTTLGITGRGAKMEIGFYVEKLIHSELSGNIIDLCPVGALTSKPFAFTSRPWELKTYNSIDVLDAMHSTIRVDVRGTKIMRILPRINENINDEWITDKIRFSYDGFRTQRLYNPLANVKSKFVKISWKKAFAALKAVLLNSHKEHNTIPIYAHLNHLADVETVFMLKSFLSLTGRGFFKKNTNSEQSVTHFWNTHITQIEKADICLIMGSNLRIQLPLLNTKIRSAVLKFDLPVYYLGNFSNLNYFVKHISTNTKSLLTMFEGSHWLTLKLSKEFSKKPMFVFNSKSVLNSCFSILKSSTNMFNDEWNGLNVINSNQISDQISISSKNNISNIYQNSSINILLNYDKNVQKSCYNVYLGHHGDNNVSKSNLVFPTTAFIEKNTHYINLFGIVQKTKRVLFNVGDSRVDWHIVYAIINMFNLKKINHKNIHNYISFQIPLIFYKRKLDFVFNSFNLNFWIFKNNVLKSNNFYLSDVLSKNSKIMSLCSNRFRKNSNNFYA